MLLPLLIAGAALADDVLVPEFTPASAADFGVSYLIYDSILYDLTDRGVNVVDADRIRDMVGEQGDACIEVTGCPTVREPSGLAMSSRNLRLSPEGLERASRLYPVMQEVAARLAGGETFSALISPAHEQLKEAGFGDIEYLDLRCEDRLEQLDRPTRPARLFAAAWMDGVRLIDNIEVAAL
mgnify:CR=1 FL=1